MKGTLKAGTELVVNNCRIRLEEDVEASVIGVSNTDQAAEQCAIAGVPIDFTHTYQHEGHRYKVTYGPQGDKVEEHLGPVKKHHEEPGPAVEPEAPPADLSPNEEDEVSEADALPKKVAKKTKK